jgi:hypothetical protein
MDETFSHTAGRKIKNTKKKNAEMKIAPFWCKIQWIKL